MTNNFNVHTETDEHNDLNLMVRLGLTDDDDANQYAMEAAEQRAVKFGN